VDDTIVMVRQGHLWGTSFHPELTDDTRLHRAFAELAVRPWGGDPATTLWCEVVP